MSRKFGREEYDVRRGERGQAFWAAMREFLGRSLATAGAIIVLGGVTYVFDRVRPTALAPLHDVLSAHLFKNADTAASFLQAIAATVITVASITFSLLLVAIQQSASSFTSQVFDQFLRQRANQFYCGFFVGVGAYALLETAAVHEGFIPIYGATLVLFLSVIAVGLLLILVYTAIDQMRPAVITEAIHDHLVEARARQLASVVRPTRRTPELSSAPWVAVTSNKTGFVRRIEIDRIQDAIEAGRGRAEVVLDVSIGTFVAYGDRLARVYTTVANDAPRICDAIEGAVRRAPRRTIDDVDATYGVQQLETVGWTSISGAKHNPQAARLVVAMLRDVLARLIAEPRPEMDAPATTAIVYNDDLPEALFQTIESLAVVTADSQQHQVAADILFALASLLERLSEDYRSRACDVLLRTLPALASHPPTSVLEAALRTLEETLARIGAHEQASLVAEGLDHLRRRIGRVETEYTPR